MRTTSPREFSPLCIGDWDCLWRLREAIPDFLEQAQPVRDSERSDLRAHGAHARILHFSFRSCKLRLSTDNAQLHRRPKAVRCKLMLDGLAAAVELMPHLGHSEPQQLC